MMPLAVFLESDSDKAPFMCNIETFGGARVPCLPATVSRFVEFHPAWLGDFVASASGPECKGIVFALRITTESSTQSDCGNFLGSLRHALAVFKSAVPQTGVLGRFVRGGKGPVASSSIIRSRCGVQ